MRSIQVTIVLTLWMGANFADNQERLAVPPAVRAAASHVLNSPLKRLWQPQVHKRMDGLMDGFKKKTPARKYRELLAEWLFDGKTRATNSIPAGPRGSLDRIEVPFVLVHDVGAWNLTSPRQTGPGTGTKDRGTPQPRARWVEPVSGRGR